MKILVVGSGTMGNSIAQVFAQAGHKVVLNDIDEKFIQAGLVNITHQLALLENNGLIDQASCDSTLANIEAEMDLEKAAVDVDLVVEAIPEKFELKENLLKKLDSLCPPKTVFASNTSGISVNDLALVVKRKDKMIGTHFFMPAYLIPLVEVVCGEATSPETIDFVMDLLLSVNKKPVKVTKVVPGFIANRLQHALAREAMSLVQKGIASPEDVDEVVKSSLAIRLVFTGPLEQRDFNGLDTHLNIAAYLYEDLEDTHTPLAILSDKVKEGKLGLKTGQGFYDWRDKDRDEVSAQKNQKLINLIKYLKNQ